MTLTKRQRAFVALAISLGLNPYEQVKCQQCHKLKGRYNFIVHKRLKTVCRGCTYAGQTRSVTGFTRRAKTDLPTQVKILDMLATNKPYGMKALKDPKYTKSIPSQDRFKPKVRFSSLPRRLRPKAEKMLKRMLAKYYSTHDQPISKNKLHAYLACCARWTKARADNPGVNFGHRLRHMKSRNHRLKSLIGINIKKLHPMEDPRYESPQAPAIRIDPFNPENLPPRVDAHPATDAAAPDAPQPSHAGAAIK